MVIDPSLRAVMFDMDGVIVDSERLHLQASTEVFRQHGIHVDSDVFITLAFGRRAVDGYRSIIERYGKGTEDVEGIAREKRDRYLELAESSLELVPNFFAFVEYCRKRSWRIALVTSGMPDAQNPILDRFGLRDMFDVSVMGDEVKNGKPDPEPYLLAMSRLGLEPSSCLVVEDAVSGIEAAKAAGCIAVGLATMLSPERLLNAGADLAVASFSELMTV